MAHSDDAAIWDAFYADSDQHWSGRPNAVLVAEVSDLDPGTALEVGCGEGADAIWLARRGWQVTAIDPSRVALDRAEAAAREMGVDVTWIQTGLREMPPGHGPFDLVTASYAVLRKDDAVVDALLGAVAVGGTLLVVHHESFAQDTADHDNQADGHAHDHDAHEHGHDQASGFDFDPADYVLPPDLPAYLDDGWTMKLLETRERDPNSASKGHAVPDVVLLAQRRA